MQLVIIYFVTFNNFRLKSKHNAWYPNTNSEVLMRKCASDTSEIIRMQSAFPLQNIPGYIPEN